MYLGDGQCCGEKEKDGVAKDDRPWGAALGGEGQTRLSRSLRGGGSWPRQGGWPLGRWEGNRSVLLTCDHKGTFLFKEC